MISISIYNFTFSMMLVWWSLSLSYNSRSFCPSQNDEYVFFFTKIPYPPRCTRPPSPKRTLFSSRYTIVTKPKICRCHKILIMNNKEKRDCLEGRRKKYLFFLRTFQINTMSCTMYILFMYIFWEKKISSSFNRMF